MIRRSPKSFFSLLFPTREALAKPLFSFLVIAIVCVTCWTFVIGDLYSGGNRGTDRHSRSGPNSPNYVLLCADGLQMGGVYAATYTAKMVYVKTFRYGPLKELVRKSMRGCHPATDADSRVSPTIGMSQPEPTSAHRLRADKFQEAFKYAGSSHSIHLKSFWSGLARSSTTTLARFYFTSQVAA